MSVLSKKHFHDEEAAFAYLEKILWPNGPTCPHCGNADAARITRLQGSAHRTGVHKCNECRQQFTVKVGTVFVHGRIPLHKMLQAVFLMSASKKGCSAHQLHRTLEVTYKTAWFLAHRIREAMRDGTLAPLGGQGKIVEADETYFANSDRSHRRAEGKTTANRGPHYKRKVLALVERGGNLRTFHIDTVTSSEIGKIVLKNVDRESAFMTDEGRHYRKVGQQFASHERVHHQAKEYVRGDAHVNTLEGFFSIFKRGMRGVYQHCGEKHLHRYLAEFDFRYNNRVAHGCNDEMRTERALSGIVGKRLYYRRPS